MATEESDPLPVLQPLPRSGGRWRQGGLLVAQAARGLWAIIVARRPVRIVVGLILLLLGVAGLFLPILQGFAMIVAALAILRKDIPLAERIWQRWIIPLDQRFQRWWQRRRQRRHGSL